MLVFSINQAESFRNIHSWIKQIDMNTSDSVAKIMIGSKCDLENERQVSKEEAENLAIKHGMEYIEVSSKEGINIDTSFEKLATVIKKQK